LLICLALLGLLAGLAASALQSTALELAMTGSEQYRARAFLAADAALAQAIVALRAAPAGTLPASLAASPLPGMNGDAYQYEIRLIGDDAPLAVASGGLQRGTHYTVSAEGDSLRGARVTVEAGMLLIHDPAGALLDSRTLYWRRSDVD
jgi:Tfp pilus assembly protein PilX